VPVGTPPKILILQQIQEISWVFCRVRFRRLFTAYYAEFESQSEPTELHKHVGAEIIYVIRGQLVVRIDGEDTTLDEVDSM
jgi:hypothetical protein